MEEKDRHLFQFSAFNNLLPCIKVCLISSLIWGLLAHGVALTTKFAVADEVHFGFSVGSTIVSGRWFLEILGRFVRFFFGSPNFSLPLTGGLLTIFLTGLCSCTLAAWMGLKSKTSWVLVSGLMMTFPVISGLFFYIFTSPYYMFGLLLLLLGSMILSKQRSWRAFGGGVILVTLSISIYQAFIPLFLSLLLTYFIKEVLCAEKWTVKILLREIFWYCSACITTILLYFLSVKLSTSLIQQELLPYKGISSMGTATISDYLYRIKLAIYLFFLPTRCDRYAFIFPYRLTDCYYLMLISIYLLGALLVLRTFKRNWVKSLSLLLVFAVFPLSANFIYVMCEQEDIYTLMQFGLLAPFLLLICLADWQFFGHRLNKPIKECLCVFLCLFCLFCVRTDNAVYTKGIFVQTRAQSYFTTLVTQIKSVPGYTSATPVAYIGDTSICMDPTFQRIDGFGALTMAPLPYDATPFCVGYDWQEFLHLWCGFAPVTASSEAFEILPEVQNMPSYPDSGSIRMIDGVVVVKFRESRS